MTTPTPGHWLDDLYIPDWVVFLIGIAVGVGALMIWGAS